MPQLNLNLEHRYSALAREMLRDGRCQQLREQLGVTQRDMGKAVGVSQIAYLQWERGQTKPKQPHAIALGRVIEEMVEALDDCDLLVTKSKSSDKS
jgi:HTH-type transcriptional regulator/antitoxin MqsA